MTSSSQTTGQDNCASAKPFEEADRKGAGDGFIAGQEDQQIATCVAMAVTTGEQLSDLPKFWYQAALGLGLTTDNP